MKSILKISLWTIALVLLSSSLFAQIRGNGNVVLKQRNVSEFSGIVVKSGIDLAIKQGNSSSVEIKADENLQQYIITEVKDDILYVYVQKNKNIWNSNALDAFVTVKDINSIKVSGGGDVESESVIKTEAIKIGISGGGDLEFALEAQKAYCGVSGGGDVELGGAIKNFSTDISGGGDLELKANLGSFEASVSGGGDAEISGGDNASDVKINISGGGDLEMNIGCQELNITISGGGDSEIEAGTSVNTARVQVSGGGDMGLELVSTELNLSISGGGDASLSGGSGKLEAVVKSGGDLYASEFKVKVADLQLAGGSDAKVNVSDKLNVTANGGGQIYVIGDPQINANLSGGSKIHTNR